MKALYFLPAIAIFGIACSQEASNPDLEKLQAQKDSLETVISKTNQELQIVNDGIKALSKDEVKRFAVSLAELNIQPFEHYIKIQGTIEADKSVQLNAQANGTVKTIYVQDGARVTAGQRLLALDTDILDQNIAELNKSLELVSFVFEKQERLWKQNIGSELDYKKAKNDKESLEQKLKTLQSQKALSIITAPFSGTVDEVFPKQGELAMAGAPMARIVNLNSLKVQAEVPENYISKVHKNDKVLIGIEGNAKPFESSIKQVASYIEPANRTFKITSAISVKEHDVLPNQLVQVHICDYRSEKALAVSNQALQQDLSGKDYVFTAQKTKAGWVAKKALVETGYSTESHTEIKSGLTAGDLIIENGARSIKEGDLLSVLK